MRRIERREFLTLGVGVFAAMSLPLALRRRTMITRVSRPLMGTIAEIQVAHRDPAFAGAAIEAGYAELGRIEALMTRFQPTSDIGRVNLGAGLDGVPVSLETARVVAAGLDWASASDGRFDPAIGAASELWDVLHRHEPPSGGDVHRLASRGFWRTVDVDLDCDRPCVRLHEPDSRLDLGAIAKGHAIDRAVGRLRDLGVEHAIVTVGGDLYALGGSPDGDPWTVGIRDPHRRDGVARTLHVADRAVATSGDYERFFRWHGVRYHHLMDPATAAPRRTPVRSVTVLADAAIDADAASTTAFGLDRDAALALVQRRLPTADVIPLT
jgi:thiamine biosynthesis lipoprotein